MVSAAEVKTAAITPVSVVRIGWEPPRKGLDHNIVDFLREASDYHPADGKHLEIAAFRDPSTEEDGWLESFGTRRSCAVICLAVAAPAVAQEAGQHRRPGPGSTGAVMPGVTVEAASPALIEASARR